MSQYVPSPAIPFSRFTSAYFNNELAKIAAAIGYGGSPIVVNTEGVLPSAGTVFFNPTAAPVNGQYYVLTLPSGPTNPGPITVTVQSLGPIFPAPILIMTNGTDRFEGMPFVSGTSYFYFVWLGESATFSYDLFTGINMGWTVQNASLGDIDDGGVTFSGVLAFLNNFLMPRRNYYFNASHTWGTNATGMQNPYLVTSWTGISVQKGSAAVVSVMDASANAYDQIAGASLTTPYIIPTTDGKLRRFSRALYMPGDNPTFCRLTY